MGQRGPQKQPTRLRMLRGESRPSRLGREFGLTPSGRADLGRATPPSPPGLGPERLLSPPG